MDQAGKRIPDETDAAFEALMMGLRTQFGVDLEAYISRYGTDPARNMPR